MGSSEEKCGGCTNSCADKGHTGESAQPKRRPRSATLLNMDWLRDRLFKVQQLKERLASSSYKIESEKIAKAVLNEE